MGRSALEQLFEDCCGRWTTWEDPLGKKVGDLAPILNAILCTYGLACLAEISSRFPLDPRQRSWGHSGHLAQYLTHTHTQFSYSSCRLWVVLGSWFPCLETNPMVRAREDFPCLVDSPVPLEIVAMCEGNPLQKSSWTLNPKDYHTWLSTHHTGIVTLTVITSLPSSSVCQFKGSWLHLGHALIVLKSLSPVTLELVWWRCQKDTCQVVM